MGVTKIRYIVITIVFCVSIGEITPRMGLTFTGKFVFDNGQTEPDLQETRMAQNG